MKRKELESVLSQNQFLKGGTKEACVKVNDFLRHATNYQNQIRPYSTSVSADEFMEAVRILMIFAYSKEDTVPDGWRCDTDCQRSSKTLCPGECCINKKSEMMCPYFVDEANV